MSSTNADIYSPPEADLEVDSLEARRSLISFSGRLSVFGYLARCAIILCALFVVVGASYWLDGSIPKQVFLQSSDAMLVTSLGFSAAIFVMVWAGFSLLTRRLHDINLRGWWALVCLIPILGALFLLNISFLPGNHEANRFGRVTPIRSWEKYVGCIGIVLMVLLIARLLGYNVLLLVARVATFVSGIISL